MEKLIYKLSKISQSLGEAIISDKIDLELAKTLNKKIIEAMDYIRCYRTLNKLKIKKGDKIKVIDNKTSHCYNIGDILRLRKRRGLTAWYVRKGWFGTLQVMHETEFNVL